MDDLAAEKQTELQRFNELKTNETYAGLWLVIDGVELIKHGTWAQVIQTIKQNPECFCGQVGSSPSFS